MPNWCLNQITITGPDPVLDDLLASADGHSQAGTDFQEPSLSFSLDALIPTPPALLAYEGWYDWRIEHWGTGSDLRDLILGRAPGLLTITCLSAWGAPLPALRCLSERYPALRIRISFEEPAMDFSGETLFESGEMYDIA